MRGKDNRLAAPDLLDVVRACYGGLLLAAPRRVLTACTREQASPRALGVVRVLGARHLLQAALTGGPLSARGPSGEIPPGRALLAGSGVDTMHAASMIGLALAHRPLRRAALADAVLESTLAALCREAGDEIRAGDEYGRGPGRQSWPFRPFRWCARRRWKWVLRWRW